MKKNLCLIAAFLFVGISNDKRILFRSGVETYWPLDIR
jgi:hypothetical protein